MLGGSEEVNRKAVEATLRAYPSLRIVGRRHGYFNLAEEPDICAEIAALRPDILWVGLGIPFEQQFCIRNLKRLRGVGIIKTAGGLLDFLSLENRARQNGCKTWGLNGSFASRRSRGASSFATPPQTRTP